jgi:coenzyme F420-0:L-glutamate ligase / coenzyme F420-1:gamma-L-glutamate ligase
MSGDPGVPDGGLRVLPVAGLPEVTEGMALGELIAAGTELEPGDVVVVSQKVVSKAEGRVVDLAGVDPRPEAREWAERWGKDARQVELVLRESAEVVRMAEGGLIISRTRHGFVCANAGVDLSNTGGAELATLLPVDPDASARELRQLLGELSGARPAIVISDSFGRPWRNGIVNVAIGAAGVESLVDLRGTLDADGREMHSTIIAVADELASAADLAGGKVAQLPVVLVRGYAHERSATERGAAALVLPREQDLFP